MPEPRIIESLRAPVNADRDTPASAGGNICIYRQEVAGLKIGDVVIASANIDDSVVKSAVAADAPKCVGVVVGGGSVGGYDRALFGTKSVGLAMAPGVGQGAAIGMSVLVQYDGIAYVVADGVIARGGTVGLAATAGRVSANSTAQQIIGVALRAAAGAGSVIPVRLSI